MVMRLFLRFAPPFAAGVMLALVIIGGPPPAAARVIGIACAIASLLAALVVQKPDLRAHATVALAVAAFIAAGQVHAGGRYALGATIFVGVCLACLRAPRTSGAPLPARARMRASIVLAAGSFVVGGLLVWQLPNAHAAMERRIARWLGAIDDEEITGFASNMRLGSTHGMLLSDRVVMRIEGNADEYLRGAVLDKYRMNEMSWTSSTDIPDVRVVTPAGMAPETATSKMVYARSARVSRGGEARWFLPVGACDLGTASGKVSLDQAGIVHPEPAIEPTTIWYRTSECARVPVKLAPPTDANLDVDVHFEAEITAIAAKWTAGARTDREKLEAIERELGRFRYSLDVRRNARIDPVVDFLTLHHEGHCEHFASAMAILARRAGIPTRVVTGYRGGDFNKLGGYTVVRERNAHAWVEAWVDGAWHAYDPTPPIDGMERESASGSAAVDVATYAIERVLNALSRITLLEWGLYLTSAVVVLYVIREITRRLAKRRARSRNVFGDFEAAHPAFDALADQLARAGHARRVSEPIESFARRLRAITAPWSKGAAEALEHYAALRYGNRGEAAEIVGELEKAAKGINVS